MILAVDVDYGDSSAIVAGVTFENWDDEVPEDIYISRVVGVADYVPGSFYKRELPCILALLTEHKLTPEIIVIDGFVYLNGIDAPGLGKHLYDALDGKIAVIGVAKRAFKGIDVKFATYRGGSKKPLYVTAEGIEVQDARRAVERMHGKYRNPALLKKVDQVCRQKC
jgi:deoxyribonuclease V